MTVEELIQILETCDKSSTVYTLNSTKDGNYASGSRIMEIAVVNAQYKVGPDDPDNVTGVYLISL